MCTTSNFLIINLVCFLRVIGCCKSIHSFFLIRCKCRMRRRRKHRNIHSHTRNTFLSSLSFFFSLSLTISLDYWLLIVCVRVLFFVHDCIFFSSYYSNQRLLSFDCEETETKKKFLNFLFLSILSFVYFSKNKNRPSNAAVSFISITSLNGGSLLLLNGGL